MNGMNIVVEKGIPLPTRLVCRERGGKWVDLLRRMEIGDSVVLSLPDYTSVHSVGRRLGFKVVSQKQPDGFTNRVWLAGKETP